MIDYQRVCREKRGSCGIIVLQVSLYRTILQEAAETVDLVGKEIRLPLTSTTGEVKMDTSVFGGSNSVPERPKRLVWSVCS